MRDFEPPALTPTTEYRRRTGPDGARQWRSL